MDLDTHTASRTVTVFQLLVKCWGVRYRGTEHHPTHSLLYQLAPTALPGVLLFGHAEFPKKSDTHSTGTHIIHSKLKPTLNGIATWAVSLFHLRSKHMHYCSTSQHHIFQPASSLAVASNVLLGCRWFAPLTQEGVIPLTPPCN